LLAAKLLLVALEDVIVGDHEVRRRDVVAVCHADRQALVIQPLLHLPLPVELEARRADDQPGLDVVIVDDADSLDRLSKTG
jgi:hypothetical protein